MKSDVSVYINMLWVVSIWIGGGLGAYFYSVWPNPGVLGIFLFIFTLWSIMSLTAFIVAVINDIQVAHNS